MNICCSITVMGGSKGKSVKEFGTGCWVSKYTEFAIYHNFEKTVLLSVKYLKKNNLYVSFNT